MRPKPTHLDAAYGDQFADQSVVDAYGFRPPYPDGVIDRLASLAGPDGAVLDLGCGTGEITRRLAGRVGRIDAVDPSAPMLAKARTLPGGDHPDLTWIHGYAEDAPIRPPYDLVYAAAALHWMDWAVVLPRVRDALTPDGVLAIVGDASLPVPWAARAQPVIDRYSTNRDYRPYNLQSELEQRGLFRETGRYRTEPVPFDQSIDEYVSSYHARNGFSRDRMAPEIADAFDREMTTIVSSCLVGGTVRLMTFGQVVWGLPAPKSQHLASG